MSEEKKDDRFFDGDVLQSDLSMSEEKILYSSLQDVAGKVTTAVNAEDFAKAMTELSGLRMPIDAFFDKVTVNSDVGSERENRLKILSQIRSTMNMVVDFSKIEG